MGFGFNLFFVVILVPLTGLLLLVWFLLKKRWIVILLGLMWFGVFSLVSVSLFTQWLTSKTKLEKEDYYGQYVVDRAYFKGKQADWQYNTFRFEITDKDSIYFYVTDEEKILKTYTGSIKTITPYSSARLIIDMEQPTHHILTSNPTTYRSAWDFYLVFESPKFYNVFFKKGHWKPIE